MYKIGLVLFGLAFIISCSDDEGSAPRTFFFVFQIVDENGINYPYGNSIENLTIGSSPNDDFVVGEFTKCLMPDSSFQMLYATARPNTVYINYGNGDIDTLFASYEFAHKSDISISSAEFCFNQEPCINIDLSIPNRESYSVRLRNFCSDTTIVYPLIKLMKK